MEDNLILDDVNPSIETVRRWGYDENIFFIDQDEDLILHDPRYVPILLELAADESCVKAEYAKNILAYFVQLVFLYRHSQIIADIAEKIQNTDVKLEPRVREFMDYFNRLHDCFVSPHEMNAEEMKLLAHDLLNGLACRRQFESTANRVNGYHEFVCSTQSYRAYVYIDPSTGHWQQSSSKRKQ
jgi:hypothetical protein